MPGIILHGRFGLELPYLGPEFRERVRLAVEEGERPGLTIWIYDEMNWPSGTANWRVVEERPDLTQRYLECLSFPVRGPWFAYLTGGDSRYIDFERSTPVAAFGLGRTGAWSIDLPPMFGPRIMRVRRSGSVAAALLVLCANSAGRLVAERAVGAW